MRQWIRKYSLTPSWTVNLKILLDICVTVTFCPQLVFPIGKLEQDKCVWNDYSLYVMSTVSNSVEHCQTVSNSVNSVNSYSAVLPPSPMVFFWPKLLKNYQSLTMTKRRNLRKTKRQQYKNSKRQFTGLESRAPFRNALRKLRRTRNPILSCEWKTVKPLLYSVYHTA